MGSNTVIVGDIESDRVTRVIHVPKYPHGIAIHDGIDRILVTSTVRPSGPGDPGETITGIEASPGKVLASPRVTDKPSPAGDGPVEILFVPRFNPPVAYLTSMLGGTLSVAVRDPGKKDFNVRRVFDFGPHKAGVPLEMYFHREAARLLVTTAKPGHLPIFDISGDPSGPRRLKTLPAAAGAHHVAFTKDGRYAVGQNSLLNLPGMSGGSITGIDMKTQQVVASVDILKNPGLNPNCIVLLPEWDDPAGHLHLRDETACGPDPAPRPAQDPERSRGALLCSSARLPLPPHPPGGFILDRREKRSLAFRQRSAPRMDTTPPSTTSRAMRRRPCG